MSNTLDDVIHLGAFLGSMSVFFMFNRYPSKAFEGNIGSMFFGSIIGCVIVVQKFWWFGFFILIPHTIKVTNFKSKKVGDKLNIETDILGKYIKK
mgnify:CR=1 FL=1